jgi:hypothetical protein
LRAAADSSSCRCGPAPGARAAGGSAASAAAASAVSEFLDATSDVPDGGDLEEHFVLTDGDRTWNPDDLAAVHTATAEDPT